MTLERERGILSPADRKYLKNPEEYSDQAAYERRQAIVTRIHEALHDFPLLVSELDGGLRVDGFGDRDLEHKDHTLNILPAAFAFLYLGITDTVAPTGLTKDAYEDMVADGVKKAHLQRGDSVRKVTVDIDVETGPPLEDLLQRDELGMIETLQLIEAGELPSKEALDVLNELLQERGDELVDEEGRFQGAAAEFPVDILDPIYEAAKHESENAE